MGKCGLCQREILTAKEVRAHRRRCWMAWGLSLVVAVFVGGLLTLGAMEYLTVRAQLKVAQRHLAEWQKIQMVDALVEANLTLRKRTVPAAARKDAQGK